MKQTEIGLIPDDWEVKTLENICVPQGIVRGPFGGALKKSMFVKIGYKVYEQRNAIYKNITDGEYYIDEPKFNEMNRFAVKANDYIISCSGTIGKIYKIPENFKKGIINQALLKLTIDEKVIFSDFFRVYFESNYFQNRIIDDTQGGAMKNLVGMEKFRKTCFPIPPLAEQQRIAKALSDVDSLISTTEKLIQKKKNIKQGTMQNLLTGKKRLPGFGDKQTDLFVPNGTHTKEVKDVSPEQIRLSAKMKQTELGEIPEDWEVKSLGEIFEFRPNNTFTRDCLNDSKGEYQNVHYGDVLIKYPSILDCSKESIPFINEGINVKFSKYGIMEGDIIIADTAEDETVGKVVEIFNLGEKKIVSGLHTFLCRKITDDFAPKWLGYFMNQAIFHNQLLPFITGTKVSAISRTAIQNVKVLIPSKEEQTAIANVLSSMDKEIETLNTKLEKYRNLKTAMMQQLLTGKIRL